MESQENEAWRKICEEFNSRILRNMDLVGDGQNTGPQSRPPKWTALK